MESVVVRIGQSLFQSLLKGLSFWLDPIVPWQQRVGTTVLRPLLMKTKTQTIFLFVCMTFWFSKYVYLFLYISNSNKSIGLHFLLSLLQYSVCLFLVQRTYNRLAWVVLLLPSFFLAILEITNQTIRRMEGFRIQVHRMSWRWQWMSWWWGQWWLVNFNCHINNSTIT